MASGSKKGCKFGSHKNLSPFESYKKYLKQVEESEGFDVDEFPALKYSGLVAPMPDMPYTRELLADFANSTIEHYNKLNGTAYELVKVLKATVNSARGAQYRITLDAKEKHKDTKTFQVKLVDFMGNIDYKFIRLISPALPQQTSKRKRESGFMSLSRGWRWRLLCKPGTVSIHVQNSSAPHKHTSGIGNFEMESSNLENVPQKSVNHWATRNFPAISNLSNITKGREKVNISLKNDSGSEEGLPKFRYIPFNIVYQNAYVHISMAGISDEDCCSSCSGDCLSSQIPCECSRETGGEFAYTPQGVLKADFLSRCMSMKRNPEKHVLVYCEDCPFERSRNEPEACRGHLVRKFIKECWCKCGCHMRCGNRVVQRGITCNLQVFWTPEGRGWGLRTLKDIPKGTFVCEYVGEILTNTELYERNLNNMGNERHTYSVTLDADWGSEKMLRDEEALCLDATYYGNVARFINHRCIDANLIDIPVEVETPDRHYYHLAFFTTREVKAMEELSWDYGNHPIKAFKCNCGSKLCQYADEEEVKKTRRQSILEASKGKRIKTTAKKEKPDKAQTTRRPSYLC